MKFVKYMLYRAERKLIQVEELTLCFQFENLGQYFVFFLRGGYMYMLHIDYTYYLAFTHNDVKTILYNIFISRKLSISRGAQFMCFI